MAEIHELRTTQSGTCRNSCRGLFGKTKRKKPLQRPTSRWRSNIKNEPQERQYKDLGSINLTQGYCSGGKIMNMAMDGKIAQEEFFFHFLCDNLVLKKGLVNGRKWLLIKGEYNSLS
jgi:hypothetical protein